MLTHPQRQFALAQPTGHLATADGNGAPHVVPVCFAVGENSAYVVIDQKPKRVRPEDLKRVRNIKENPRAVLLVDRYDEDWRRLGWLALHCHAELLTGGDERIAALGLLRDRYPQYQSMDIEESPVIALRIERVTDWGQTEG